MFPLCVLCLLWLGGLPSHAQDPLHPPGKNSRGEGPKLVCYHTSWTENRTGKGKFTAEDIDPFLCTHLVYAYAVLDDKSLTMKPRNHQVDVQNKGYERVVSLKKKNGRLKVLLLLGYWQDSRGDKYSRMVADDHSRQEFVRNAVETLKLYRFDGLDLEWLYPVCWQNDCSAGPSSDKDNFSRLLKELREAFDQEKPPLLLMATVSARKAIADSSYDADSLAKYTDFVSVMSYFFRDYNGGKTRHPAPLYQQPEDSDKYNNVMASMKYWNRVRGVAKEKLILGVSMEGKSFTLTNSSLHGLNAPTKGIGTAGEHGGEAGFLSYTERCLLTPYPIIRDQQLAKRAFFYHAGCIFMLAAPSDNNYIFSDIPIRIKRLITQIRLNKYKIYLGPDMYINITIPVVLLVLHPK